MQARACGEGRYTIWKGLNHRRYILSQIDLSFLCHAKSQREGEGERGKEREGRERERDMRTYFLRFSYNFAFQKAHLLKFFHAFNRVIFKRLVSSAHLLYIENTIDSNVGLRFSAKIHFYVTWHGAITDGSRTTKCYGTLCIDDWADLTESRGSLLFQISASASRRVMLYACQSTIHKFANKDYGLYELIFLRNSLWYHADHRYGGITLWLY